MGKLRPIHAPQPSFLGKLCKQKTGWNVNSNRLRMQGYVWLTTTVRLRGKSDG